MLLAVKGKPKVVNRLKMLSSMSTSTKLLLVMVAVMLIPFVVYTVYSYTALERAIPTMGESALLSRWLWTTLLLGVIGVLVVYTVVHGTVVLPMKRIKTSLSRYIEEGSTAPIEPMGDRELDEVIEYLNSIVGRYKKALEQLSSTYDELKVLDELKSELISVVSHETRTSLAVAMGNVELMLDGAFGELTQTQKERLRLVLEKHTELKRMIDRLSLLAEAEAQELTPDYEPIDIGALLRECVDAVVPMALYREQEVRLSVPDELPVVQADRKLLTSAIMELLQNAVLHSGKGTKIEASAVPQEEGLIRIEIRDNGVGIPPAVLRTIFEPLTASSPHTGAGSSTLGLCIVKGIMDAHKGILEIESTEGKGTVCTLLIPVEPKSEV